MKKEPLKLPEPDGTPVTLNEKVYVPVREHPDVSTEIFLMQFTWFMHLTMHSHFDHCNVICVDCVCTNSTKPNQNKIRISLIRWLWLCACICTKFEIDEKHWSVATTIARLFSSRYLQSNYFSPALTIETRNNVNLCFWNLLRKPPQKY